MFNLFRKRPTLSDYEEIINAEVMKKLPEAKKLMAEDRKKWNKKFFPKKIRPGMLENERKKIYDENKVKIFGFANQDVFTEVALRSTFHKLLTDNAKSNGITLPAPYAGCSKELAIVIPRIWHKGDEPYHDFPHHRGIRMEYEILSSRFNAEHSGSEWTILRQMLTSDKNGRTYDIFHIANTKSKESKWVYFDITKTFFLLGKDKNSSETNPPKSRTALSIMHNAVLDFIQRK